MGESRRRLEYRDGVAHEAIHDLDVQRMVVKSSQDVEPVLDSIARDRELMRNDNDEGKLVGRLPAVVVVDLINRGIFHDPDAFDRWWNSFEADPWKIWDGRV